MGRATALHVKTGSIRLTEAFMAASLTLIVLMHKINNWHGFDRFT
jgi:hypothetical protein